MTTDLAEPDLSTGADVRTWVYGEVAALFDAIPNSLGRLGHSDGSYPATRIAVGALRREFRSRSRETLEAEHVRLFVNAPGGVPAPPYASYYLDGALHGPSCHAAAVQYRRQGLEPVAGQPADYVGMEFEFLYFLGRHQRAARATHDDEAGAAAACAEAAFFGTHVGVWVPRFAAAIGTATGGRGFYGRLGALLASFCAEERPRIEVLAKRFVALGEKTAHRPLP